MKIVKNNCYGGFGLSVKAQQRLAELLGKQVFFFSTSFNDTYESISPEEAESSLLIHGYTVPDPENYRLNERDSDGLCRSANERAKSITLPDYRSSDLRTDLNLVKVVEELGEEANGMFAELVVVEIPDGVKWEIDEYDGLETIHEVHQSW